MSTAKNIEVITRDITIKTQHQFTSLRMPKHFVGRPVLVYINTRDWDDFRITRKPLLRIPRDTNQLSDLEFDRTLIGKTIEVTIELLPLPAYAEHFYPRTATASQSPKAQGRPRQ